MRFAIVTGLSAMRIPLAGLFLFLVLDPAPAWRRASACVLALLLASDVLDGWLARRWNVVSTFGYVLDGVADRASYIAALLAVAARFGLHPLIAYGLITRDLILYAARALSPQWSSRISATRALTKAYALAFRLGLAAYFLLDYGDAFGLVTVDATTRDVLLTLFHITMGLVLVFAYASLLLLLRRYVQRVEEHLTSDRGHDRQQG